MVTGNTVSNNAFDKRNNIVLQVAEKVTKKAHGKKVRLELQIKDLWGLKESCISRTEKNKIVRKLM